MIERRTLVRPASCYRGNHLALREAADLQEETVVVRCEYCTAQKTLTYATYNKMAAVPHKYLLFTLP